MNRKLFEHSFSKNFKSSICLAILFLLASNTLTYANGTDEPDGGPITVSELLEGPKQVCGPAQPVAKLDTIFESFGSLSCESFRLQQKDEEYCTCIESVTRPENYDEELYKNTIYDAYLELVIQRDNRTNLAQMEALIPIHYAYKEYPSSEEENKSCFSKSYNAIGDANSDNEYVRDRTMSQIQAIESIAFRNNPIEQLESRKSNDRAFISDLLIQFSEEIVQAQNTYINSYLGRPVDSPIPGNVPAGQIAEAWEQAKNQFRADGDQNLRKILVKNKEKIQNSNLINNSSFEMTKNALNLTQLTDRDRDQALRPISSALWGALNSTEFLDSRFTNAPIQLDQVEVTEEAIKAGLVAGGVVAPYQCFSLAHSLVNEEKRKRFRRNREPLKQRFENEINDNNPVKQILLMSQIEQSLLFDNAEGFLSRLELDQYSIAESDKPEEKAQEKDEALMTLKYSLGKMRCRLTNNDNGATEFEVTTHLSKLESETPGTLQWSSELSADYLDLSQEIEADLELMEMMNSRLVNEKATLLRIAKNAGIIPRDKYRLSAADIESIKQSDKRSAYMDQLMGRIENDLEQISRKDEEIRESEVQLLEIRAELTERLGENIANGLIASRISPQYEVYSGVIDESFGAGYTYIESQTAIEMAESGDPELSRYAFFSGGGGRRPATVALNTTNVADVIEVKEDTSLPKSTDNVDTTTDVDLVEDENEVRAVVPQTTLTPTAVTPLEISSIQDIAKVVLADRAARQNFEHREIFEREERKRNVSANDSVEERRQRYHNEERFAEELEEQIEESEEAQEELRIVREANDINEEDFFENDATKMDGYDQNEDFGAFRNVTNEGVTDARMSDLDKQIKAISERASTEKSVINEGKARTFDDQEAVNTIKEREEAIKSQAEAYNQSRTEYEAKYENSTPLEVQRQQDFDQVIKGLKQEVQEQVTRNEQLRDQIQQDVIKNSQGETSMARETKNSNTGSNVGRAARRIPQGFSQAAAKSVDFNSPSPSSVITSDGVISDNGDNSDYDPSAFVGSEEKSVILDEDGNPMRESSAIAYGSDIFKGLEVQYTNENAISLPRKLTDGELQLMQRGPASNVQQEAIAIDTSYLLTLINTPNEISQEDFLGIKELEELPKEINIQKPLAIRTRTGHVLVRPIMEEDKVTRFEFLGEVKVDSVSSYLDQQDKIILQAHERLVKYENLKRLMKNKSK